MLLAGTYVISVILFAMNACDGDEQMQAQPLTKVGPHALLTDLLLCCASSETRVLKMFLT